MWKFLNILFLTLSIVANSFAEKKLIYDPQKGIISLDGKNNVNKKNLSKKPSKKKTRNKFDLQLSKKKISDITYFKTGISYYKKKEYTEAEKYFNKAYKIKNDPLYLYWLGLAKKKNEAFTEFIKTMQMILKKHTNSNIADDALFELAIFYIERNNYDRAKNILQKINEQYPFSESILTKRELRPVSDSIISFLDNEIINLLKITKQKNILDFQKKNNLPITQKADSATVTMLKEKAEKILATNLAQGKNYKKNIFFFGNIYMVLLFVLLSIALIKTRVIEERINVIINDFEKKDLK